MSEVPSFDPNTMHNLFKKGRIAFASQEDAPESRKALALEIPREGKIVERDGNKYRWERARSGAMVMDRETWQKVPHYHTLRTYFSHTSQVEPNGEWINGPGWDRRRSLDRYTETEMLEQFGHIFTQDEIDNPAGTEDFQTGEITGGMPDDVPYYELELIEEDDSTD